MNTVQKKLTEASKLLESGKIQEAIDILENIININHEVSHAYFLLGVGHFRTKKTESAAKYFRKAISLNVDDHFSNYYLGLVHEQNNNIKEALKHYRIALLINPNFSEALEKINKIAPKEAQDLGETSPNDRSLAKTIQENGTFDSKKKIAGDLLISKHPRLRSLIGWFLSIMLIGLFFISEIPERRFFHYFDEGSLVALAIYFIIALIITFIKSRTTKYSIYQRRIDLKTGILFRKEISIWLYQIQEVSLKRGPLNILTSDAKVCIRATLMEQLIRAKPGQYVIKGLGNYKQMKQFYQELRDASLVERREMKSVWV